MGWAEASSFAPFAAIFLEDPSAGERAALRVALTAEIVADQATAVEHVVPRGETRVERLISLVLLGDLVSLYAAVLRGADPLCDRADRPAQGGPRRALSGGRGRVTAR